jgi:hypothetical protein
MTHCTTTRLRFAKCTTTRRDDGPTFHRAVCLEITNVRSSWRRVVVPPRSEILAPGMFPFE